MLFYCDIYDIVLESDTLNVEICKNIIFVYDTKVTIYVVKLSDFFPDKFSPNKNSLKDKH